MNKKIASVLGGLLLLVSTAPVFAQTPDVIDHYTITLGTFLSSQDATLRVDGSGGTPGTPIDFEDTFGLDKSADLFRYNIDWRMGKKHVLSFGGFRTSRENSKRLTGDIEYDGVTYPYNTLVTGKLAINFYDLAYTYYPYLRQDRAFGVTGSLVTMSMNSKLTSEPDSGTGVSEFNRKSSANLPAPGFGISYRQRFAGNWQFDTRASFLPKITIDKYNAKTANVNASVEYRFLNHYSFGAAYDYFSFTAGVDADNVDFSGSLKYSIQGPQVFGRFYW